MTNYELATAIHKYTIDNPKETMVVNVIANTLRLPVILPLYALNFIGEQALKLSYIIDSWLRTAKAYYYKHRIGGSL